MRVERWGRAEIRELAAYHVENAVGLIKLDAMENPYDWPKALVDNWLECLRSIHINRYPDPDSRSLKQRLREAMTIPDDQEILLGNGSDELIQIIALALAGDKATVMAPEPTFVMYRLIASITRMPYIGIPLRADGFALDMVAFRESIELHQPAIIFLAYPNNPTGNLWSRTDIEEIISLAPGLVVVDEAYAPFASDSFLEALGHHKNLLVMRTVSKMGLAGLRLGLLVGPKDWIEQINKVRLPYNINVLTQASAEFALHHKAVLDQQAAQILRDRKRLFERLSAITDISVFPSEANFILFRTPHGRGAEIFEKIKAQGVLIKNLSAHNMLTDCLRVTIGKPEENERFIQVLKQAL